MIAAVKYVAPGLYRGPRPESRDDMFSLWKNRGVDRIVNLQGYVLELAQVEEERLWASNAEHGIDFHHVPMDLVTPPTQADIAAALTAALAKPGTTYLHCHDGVDRTGVVCMAYRMIVAKWTLGRAIGEMYDAGFHWGKYALWSPFVIPAIEALAAGPDPWQD